MELIHSEELYCSFFDCCGFEFESVFFEEFEEGEIFLFVLLEFDFSFFAALLFESL